MDPVDRGIERWILWRGIVKCGLWRSVEGMNVARVTGLLRACDGCYDGKCDTGLWMGYF